ncbi:MAG TPA: S41 family peptidase [Pyrinomonadaceae bacterium]|jgi:C-terminal processing protease CtpA/Prc|nr:S41 family peptidase [Pyrinomonadaceae bacterium]
MKKQIIKLTLFALVAISFVLNPEDGRAQQGAKQADMTIDAATRTQVIDAVLKELNDRYVFPEVAKQMETNIRQRIGSKEYDSITSAEGFAKKLTEDLQSVSKDKHLRVRYSEQLIPVRKQGGEPNPEERAQFENYMKRINFAFEKVERLPGNIGYIKLNNFFAPELGAETVAAAMNFVTNTDALIFDLRENGGGDPEMVALISSYLFGDKPVHLNSLYWREGNRTEDFFTKPTVIGKKYGDKDVYILTANRTFSAAEEFTNNLKVLKRATIVGETTGGGANPGGMFRVGEHFGVFVPTGRAVNPITKTNWEGTGVEPDVKVSKELALKTAYLTALNKSLEKTKDEDFKRGLKDVIEKTQKELDDMKKVAQK